jgi:hypothetical protein
MEALVAHPEDGKKRSALQKNKAVSLLVYLKSFIYPSCISRTKKAGLPVIRQPGCPFIFPQDPRLSAHRSLGVRLLLIKVTTAKLSHLYDRSQRPFTYLPPTLFASALRYSLRFRPRI